MDDPLGDGSTVSSPSTLSKALQTTLLCPTFVANLLGNICVCLAVSRVHSLRQRPGIVILASLAISDLSLSPFLLFRLIWLYDYEAATKPCEFFAMLICTHSLVTVLLICLLSCDRYVAIVHPLRYTTIITKRRVRWALAVVLGAPVISKLIISLSYRDTNSSRFKRSMIGCLELDMNIDNEPSLVHKVHIAFNLSFLIAIPFAVIVFVYARIAKISCSHGNRVEPGEHLNPETAERRKKERKEMKWMKTIVMVIGAFAICHLTSLVDVTLSATVGPSRVPESLRTSAVLLTGMHSALNPLIYMLRSNKFKRAFRKYFRRVSNEPTIINNTTTRTGLSHVELSSRDPRNDRLPSFLSVSNENATSAEPKSELTATASVQLAQDVKATSLSQVVSPSDQCKGPQSFQIAPDMAATEHGRQTESDYLN